MTPVTPVMDSRYACYDSCYARYGLLLWFLLWLLLFLLWFLLWHLLFLLWFLICIPVITIVWIAMNAFIRFYIRFPVLWLLCYTCSYLLSTCILTYLFPVLIWSYHEYFLLDIIVMYTFVLILARHLAFTSPLAWGVLSDSPGFSCPGHGAWSVWILPVADQSGAAEAWISSKPFRATSFQAPCVPLEFSFCKLVSALFTVYSCTSLVFSQLRHSGDVILL